MTISSVQGSYQERTHAVLVSLIIDFVLIGPDIVAAVMAHSVVLFADVLKCCNELLATFLGWLTLRRVAHGRTFNYNYGYGKLENLSGIVVALAMAVSLIIVLYTAVIRLHHPEAMHIQGVGLGIFFMALGVCTNVYLWKKNRRLAQHERSPVMEAQWRLFRVKAFSDATVLFALLLSLAFRNQAWSHYIDPCAALIMIGFLIFSAYGVMADTVTDLLDKALEESLQLIIVKHLAVFFDDYTALHGVRSRRSGGDIYIEIFLEFDPQHLMGDVQKAIDRIKLSLEREISNSHVVVSPCSEPEV